MGSWGTGIRENDTFADVYDYFFDLYNNGATAEIASERIRLEFLNESLDSDDMYDAHFALALAQWETKVLEPSLLNQVADFIQSGAALGNWEEGGASQADLRKRRLALDAFLRKLSKSRASKKARKNLKKHLSHEIRTQIVAPDESKVFVLYDGFDTGNYYKTAAVICWVNGVHQVVFYATGQDFSYTATWMDQNNIEIIVEEGSVGNLYQDHFFQKKLGRVSSLILKDVNVHFTYE